MHPCCNGSLQTGTKIIAIVQLVCAIFIIIGGILALTAAGVVTSKFKELEELDTNSTSTESEDDAEKRQAFGVIIIVMSVLLLVVGVVYLLTSILLLNGANKRNRTMCMVWFVLTAISLIYSVSTTIGSFVSGDILVSVSRIFGLGLQSYFMWVVWAFMTELKEGVAAAGPPYVTTKITI